ncbi:MAG: class I SAM-dependent methyltransferase [Acidimicrobiales bacterium]
MSEESNVEARRMHQLSDSYDKVASEYAKRILHELDYKPLDRALLAALIEEIPSGSIIADVGCGPGHVAAWLASHGATVLGVDLSPGMVDVARSTFPDIEFSVGDMRFLPYEDGEWGGAVALYSLIHLEPVEMPIALAELFRCLRPGGLILVAFHLGSEVRHRDEWWGIPVSLDFRFLEAETVERSLQATGFTVCARLEREPYPDEVSTRRAYILARRLDS